MTAGPAAGGLPLLIIGHGTRDATGVAQFRQLIGRVRDQSAGWLPAVDGGFIELAAPSVSEVVPRLAGGKLVNGGPGDVVAVPLVLTAAGHGKGDIPAALAREQVRHPGLRYRYGRPLGPHPVLLDVLEARIDEALGVTGPGEQVPGGKARGKEARAGTHVVLVGRGSTDPDGNAEVAKVARLLWEGRGYADVALSFISLTGPSVPAALERARRLGAERIVVAPYFLFAGVLPDRVTAQAGAFEEQHPEIDVRVSGLIGACDELAGLVLERYAEALHGDIRMNCDTCAYRIAMPGFADKVGLAQTPHHHPHDLAAGHRHP
ncbi:MAG TPA: sirohydrochlorin chelatase [Streptosporangiaceae bacterium]